MRVFIAFAVGIGCLVLLSVVLMNKKSGQTIIVNGATTDTSRVSADELEQEVRAELPPGSSLAMVDDLLTKRKIEHSFNASSKTLYATARKLKGSTMLSSKSLTLRFYFDDASELKSIDANVSYTGT